MESENEAVVVPLVPLDVVPSTETMLRMLLDREAVVLRRVAVPTNNSHSGMVAHASGAFAKAVSQAASQFARDVPNDGLYQLILPTGAVTRDLVPAVGGGFRSMVRAADSTKFVGEARLIPAAAGAGAAVAAGPLIATVALAVAGEMLAQHQMNKKLDSIRSAVHGIQNRFNAQDRAVIVAADHEAKKVIGYLLDQAQLPPIAGAAFAFGNLTSLTYQNIDKLNGWLEAAATFEHADRVNGHDLMTKLVGRHDNPIQEFERLVALTYESLALRARVVLLEKVAAEFANPNRSLSNVEGVLRRDLSTLAGHQANLSRLLDDLSVMQIDGTKIPIAVAGKGTLEMRTSFGRLARALHSTPDGIPVLTESDRTVLELAPDPEGLAVVTPEIAQSA